MQISIVMFIFCFRVEITFLGKFVPKNQNCLSKLKFECADSMVVLNFSFLDLKYPIWQI